MKRVVFVFIILALCSSAMFAKENNSYVLSDGNKNEKVLKSDKIIIIHIMKSGQENYSLYKAPDRLKFKDIYIDLSKINPLASHTFKKTEYNKIVSLFSAAGGRAEILLNRYLNIYNKNNDELIKTAIIIFNNIIKNDEKARKRIENVYRRLRIFMIKESKIKEMKNKIKEKMKKCKLVLLHLTGGMYAGKTNFDEHLAVESDYGLRFSYYFMNPMAEANLGFIFEFSYLTFGYSEDKGFGPSDDVKYISFNFGFALKLYGVSRNNSFNITLGFCPLIKVSSANAFSYTDSGTSDFIKYEYVEYIPTIAISIEYLLIIKCFTFLISLYSKFGLSHTFDTYINGVKDKYTKKYFSIGIKFGIGFNFFNSGI